MGTEATAPAERAKIPFNYRLSPALRHGLEQTAGLFDPKTTPRPVRAGHEIIGEGRRCASVFIILEGIAIRYRVLRDGARQVLNIVIPGDFAGVPSCCFETALYSVRSLTPMTLLPVPVARVVALLETNPKAAARLLWGFASQSAIYAERLITVSRRSALERVAHFLLELLTRLRAVGLADECSYRLPLTQEMLSDALGLSIPYVNRVLHQLREEGLVRIKDQLVTIDNLEELSVLADFDPNYLKPLSLRDFAAEPG